MVRRDVALAFLMAVTAAACAEKPRREKVGDREEDAEEASSRPTEKKPSGPAAGRAFVSTPTRLYVIDKDGKVAVVPTEGFVEDVALSQNGTPLVRHGSIISKVVGDKLETVAPEVPSLLRTMVVTSSNEVWAIGYAQKTLERFDGKAWSTVPSGMFTKTEEGPIIHDLVLDPEGRVVVALGTSGIARLEGNTWSILPETERRGPMRLSAIEGGWFVANKESIGELRGTSFESMFTTPDAASIGDVAVGPGKHWAFTQQEGATGVKVTLGEGARSMRTASLPDVAELHSPVVDGRGRVWLFSKENLYVTSPREGEDALLGGERVTGVAVEGSGPDRLPAQRLFESVPSEVASAPPASSTGATGGPSSTPVPGPKGNAALGGASISGGAVGNASAVVAGMAAGFRRCYQRGLVDDPSMKGSVRITAKIGPKGEVMSASPSGGGGLSPTVVSCVAAVVSSRTFDKPEGGGATIVIPVSFFPA